MIPRDCDDQITPASTSPLVEDARRAARNELLIADIVRVKLSEEQRLYHRRPETETLVSLVIMAEVHTRMASHYTARANARAAEDASADEIEKSYSPVDGEIDSQEEQGEEPEERGEEGGP
jgi:hypothetical protein